MEHLLLLSLGFPSLLLLLTNDKSMLLRKLKIEIVQKLTQIVKCSQVKSKQSWLISQLTFVKWSCIPDLQLHWTFLSLKIFHNFSHRRLIVHCKFGPVPQMSTGRPLHMGSKRDEICTLGLKSLHTPSFVFIILKGMKSYEQE